MNREEAIQKAERALIDPIAKGGGVALLELDHLRVLLEALRGKGAAICSPWVKTTDRLPTKEDADDEGKVTALITGMITGKLLSLSLYYASVTAESAEYFLPIPKLPEVEE